MSKKLIHSGKCGGAINRKTLICTRCKKKPLGKDVVKEKNFASSQITVYPQSSGDTVSLNYRDARAERESLFRYPRQ